MTPKPTTILALVLALCMTAAAQQLSVENPPSVLLDKEFTANVTASGCNITGIEFTLAFDGSILKALNVMQGDFFSGATMTIPSNLSETINEGRVTLGIALMAGQDCGNGSLAEIRFKGTSAGDSDLRLENVTITDEGIQVVQNFSLVNSSVLVSSPTTTTTTSTTTSSTTTTTTIPVLSSEIIINEVMYDPGNGYRGEFVELYNDGDYPVNLSGWKISDSTSTDDLECFNGGSTVIAPKGYAVITPKNTSVTPLGNSTHLATDDKRIGNGLNNDGDIVSLIDINGNLTDRIDYSQMPWCDENRSLERISPDESYWNGSLEEGGTPGYANSVSPGGPRAVLDYYLPLKVLANKGFKMVIKVNNEGQGALKNFAITSAQPMIKGKSKANLNCNVSNSSLVGKSKGKSLAMNFSDINPGTSKLVHWTMKTQEDGNFTEFKATFRYQNSVGKVKKLSTEIRIHTLEREIYTGSANLDFLVDFDRDGIPDQILESVYGNTTNVSKVNYSVHSQLPPRGREFSIEINKSGWVYIPIDDPYNNTFPIEKITTENGTLLHSQNYWLEDNKIYIVDDPAQRYNITYNISVADIVINEIMYNPLNESCGEFVELYNKGNNSVNLTGWAISDSQSTDTLEGFNGDSAIIPPGGYAMITSNKSCVQIAENSTHLSTGDARIGNGLSNSGETITLRDDLRNLIDQMNYTGSTPCLDGHSLERVDPEENSSDSGNWFESPTEGGTPGSENDALPETTSTVPTTTVPTTVPTTIIQTTTTTTSTTSTSTPLTTTLQPATYGLVINEIMYNPDQCSDSYCEWIEVYNPTNQSIDLSGWYLCEDRLMEGYIDYPNGLLHSVNGMLIPSDGYALITDGGTGTLLYTNFNASLDAIALHVDAGSMCGGLSNSGETITLSNGSIAIALSSPYSKSGLGESITYDSSWGANGNGYSLERINPSADPADAVNWGESLTLGGSPGFRNTLYMLGVNGSTTTTSTSSSTTTSTSSSSTTTTLVTTSTTITSSTTSTLTTTSTSTTTIPPSFSTTSTTTSTTTTTTTTSSTTTTGLLVADFDSANPPAMESEIICKPDGKKNYRETGIDCGGPCRPCPETTTVTTLIEATSTATTSVMATPVTTSITTIITTTTIPSAPGIIGSVIAFSREWADEFSIAAILLLLSATGYAMKKGRGSASSRWSDKHL